MLWYHVNFCECSPDPITYTMNPPQSVRVADSHPLQVTEMAWPVRIAQDTSVRSVTLDLFALAIISSTDNILTLGCPTVEYLI